VEEVWTTSLLLLKELVYGHAFPYDPIYRLSARDWFSIQRTLARLKHIGVRVIPSLTSSAAKKRKLIAPSPGGLCVV
jgi:hypothetical protein